MGAGQARPPPRPTRDRSSPAAIRVGGRQLLQWNNDIEVSICKPTEEQEGFYRNGEGDEVVFVHHGSGVLRTIFGRVPYRPATTS